MMKIFSALVKMRMASIFGTLTRGGKRRNGKTTSKTAMIVLWTFAAVGFLFMFLSFFMGFGAVYFDAGLDWLYFSMMALFAFAFMFVGSVFITETQIFEAKDNELLMSMPIPSAYIIASRMISLLLLNYVYEALVSVPAFVSFCIFGKVTFLKVLVYIIITATLPFLAMAITLLFAWILSLITSRMKRKTVFQMIISVAFLALYFVFYFNLQRYVTFLMEEGENISSALGGVFIIYWFGNAIASENFLHLLFCVSIYFAAFALVYALISATFVKMVTSSRGAPMATYVAKRQKSRGTDAALVRRELNRFFSSSAYMLNCGLGLLFMVGISIYAVIEGGNYIAALDGGVTIDIFGTPVALRSDVIAPIAAFALCAMQSMSTISTPSVSLEGKYIWISQSLPVDPSRVLASKVRAHMIIAAPVTLICSAIILIFFPTTVAGAIGTVSAPLCTCAFVAVLGVKLNVRFPRLDWTNEAVAVKQGAAVLLTIGISLATVMIMAVLGVFLFAIIPPDIYVILYASAIAVAAVILYQTLKSSGGKKFAEL